MGGRGGWEGGREGREGGEDGREGGEDGKEGTRRGWEGGRGGGEGGNKGWEGGIGGGREEAMMLGRESASVEEGGLMKGTNEEGTERVMDSERERGEGGSERRRD